MKVLSCFVLSLLMSSAFVLAAPAPDKPAEKKLAPKADEKPEKKGGWSSDTWSGLALRPIGPALTSGRIVDIAVDPTNPQPLVPGRGLRRRLEDGERGHDASTPVFDGEGSYSIGCVAHRPERTRTSSGSAPARTTASAASATATGSTARRTAARLEEPVGLKKSEHIGKILIDPKDLARSSTWPPRGRSGRPGGDRGLYKTTDGGKTWKAVLDHQREHRRHRRGDGPARTPTS